MELKRRNLRISGEILALIDRNIHPGIITKTELIRQAIRAIDVSNISPGECDEYVARQIPNPTRICFAINDDDYKYLNAIAEILKTSKAAALEYVLTKYLKHTEQIDCFIEDQMLQKLWQSEFLQCNLDRA